MEKRPLAGETAVFIVDTAGVEHVEGGLDTTLTEEKLAVRILVSHGAALRRPHPCNLVDRERLGGVLEGPMRPLRPEW